MSSAFDDLVRRERAKLDFLTSQTGSVLQPLREHERFIERMMTPGIRSALDLRNDLASIYAPTPGFDDYRMKFLEEATNITRLLDSKKRAFDDIASLHQSSRFTDQLADIFAPRLVDQLKALTTPTFLSEFRNALAPSAASLRDLAFADFSRTALSSTASIARFMNDATKPSGVTDMITDFLAEAERLASPMSAVTPEGIRVDADLVAAADLTAHLRKAVAQATAMPRSDRLGQFLSQCLVVLRKAPKPIAKALFVIISTILLMILEGEVQEVSKELLAHHHQALMAKIRKLSGTQAARPKESRQDSALRVVTAKNTLKVRIYPRKPDSRILGTLELGTVVVAVREVKDWTLVEYQEGECVITGWVYTRHIKKIVLPATP